MTTQPEGMDIHPTRELITMPNHLLHGKNNHYFWQGVGLLSLKTFFGGRALYDVGDGRFAVDERAYLLLNHLQPYAITIDAEQKVESFCVFFEAGFAEEVLRSRRSSTETLLDTPQGASSSSLSLFDRTYPHDDLLSPVLFQLRRATLQSAAERVWLEEQFHHVLECLLQAQQIVRAEVEMLHAVRASTREELYRRLHRARDYAEACLHQPLSIAELANVACLSPNHFLRTFKQLFRQSPHQYLTAKRLEAAQRLLRQTDATVTEICFEVGFESLGSFSDLFRRRVGLSPDAYRRRKR